MNDERIIYKGRRVPLVLSELARVTKERDKAIKERDEAREAFMVTYDELEDFHCSWCSRQSAMPKEVEPFAGLYERLKREASGEAKG